MSDLSPAPLAKLYAKLAAVMAAMSRIEKNGTNKHFNYKYATAEDVADAVRSQLAAQNIAFFAEMIESFVENGVREVVFEFTFACGDTGAVVSKRWRSESRAGDDKSINKCATAAEKYFLLKTFIISTGDEPDADADGDQPARTPAAKSHPPAPITSSDLPSPSGTPRSGEGLGGESAPKPAWTAEVARFWAKRTREQRAITDADILAALNVERLGDWTRGAAEAEAAVTTYIAAQMSAPAKPKHGSVQ